MIKKKTSIMQFVVWLPPDAQTGNGKLAKVRSIRAPFNPPPTKTVLLLT
jgi:hypothetical protein